MATARETQRQQEEKDNIHRLEQERINARVRARRRAERHEAAIRQAVGKAREEMEKCCQEKKLRSKLKAQAAKQAAKIMFLTSASSTTTATVTPAATTTTAAIRPSSLPLQSTTTTMTTTSTTSTTSTSMPSFWERLGAAANWWFPSEKLRQLQDTILQQLIQELIVKAEAEARVKCGETFRRLAHIRLAWRRLEAAIVFTHWRQRTREERRNKQVMAYEMALRRQQEYEQAICKLMWAQSKVSEWRQEWDDRQGFLFYLHPGTGETRLTLPGVEEYMPAGWVAPVPLDEAALRLVASGPPSLTAAAVNMLDGGGGGGAGVRRRRVMSAEREDGEEGGEVGRSEDGWLDGGEEEEEEDER
jgi:hypothetical protein